MENDDIQIGRVLSRREALGLIGTAGIVMLAGCGGGSGTAGTGSNNTSTNGSAGTSSGGASGVVVTPAVTEGPFFVDENLNRSNLLIGTTRASVINGVPLAVNFNVSQVNGSTVTALSGAHVDIWHADAIGTYSDESSGSIQSENTRGQMWLRGYQVTDANGAATFNTIYPGWYMGRAVHIHFKIRLYSAAGSKTYEFTSQLFMDDTLSDTIFTNAPYNTRGTRTTRNANDSVYNTIESDGAIAGPRLLLSLAKAGSGYTGTFAVGLQIS